MNESIYKENCIYGISIDGTCMPEIQWVGLAIKGKYIKYLQFFKIYLRYLQQKGNSFTD